FIDVFNKVNRELISGEQQHSQRELEQENFIVELDQLEQKLISALRNLGYAGIENVAASLLNPTELDAFSREEANLKNEEVSLNSRLQQVSKSIEAERKSDQSDKSMEACIEELETIVSSIRDAENQRNIFAGKLSAN